MDMNKDHIVTMIAICNISTIFLSNYSLKFIPNFSFINCWELSIVHKVVKIKVSTVLNGYFVEHWLMEANAYRNRFNISYELSFLI